LTVSLNIVKNHNGEITAESVPGAGAEFTVTLPRPTPEELQTFAAEKSAGAPPMRPRHPRPFDGRIRILVVDDEEFITAMLQESLRQSFACMVERVESGQRAIARLQQTDFDLVISDVRMPEMDGFGLFEWILRQQPRLAGHFLFITGDAGSASLNEKLESMAIPVLHKPFEIDKLLALCRKLLQTKSAVSA